MYLKRKIDSYLDEWILKKDKSPLLIVGIRQCGKNIAYWSFQKEII